MVRSNWSTSRNTRRSHREPKTFGWISILIYFRVLDLTTWLSGNQSPAEPNSPTLAGSCATDGRLAAKSSEAEESFSPHIALTPTPRHSIMGVAFYLQYLHRCLTFVPMKDPHAVQLGFWPLVWVSWSQTHTANVVLVGASPLFVAGEKSSGANTATRNASFPSPCSIEEPPRHRVSAIPRLVFRHREEEPVHVF